MLQTVLIVAGWLGAGVSLFWALLLAYVLWLRSPKVEFRNARVHRFVLADFWTHLVCALLLIFFDGIATIAAWRGH